MKGIKNTHENTPKQLTQEGNKNLNINNYLKCKGIKCYNQMTQAS